MRNGNADHRGRAEVICFSWCWGEGGDGGNFFFGGSNNSLKKIQTATIWKNYNICAVKNVKTKGSRKIVMGGKPNTSPTLPPCRKGDPPPPPLSHGKNDRPHVERKDCQHKKYPHRGNSTHPPPPPPPHGIFYSCFPPPESLLSPPPACADHDLHSLYSVCLRELEKKSIKIKQKQKNSGSHL